MVCTSVFTVPVVNNNGQCQKRNALNYTDKIGLLLFTVLQRRIKQHGGTLKGHEGVKIAAVCERSVNNKITSFGKPSKQHLSLAIISLKRNNKSEANVL